MWGRQNLRSQEAGIPYRGGSTESPIALGGCADAEIFCQTVNVKAVSSVVDVVALSVEGVVITTAPAGAA